MVRRGRFTLQGLWLLLVLLPLMLTDVHAAAPVGARMMWRKGMSGPAIVALEKALGDDPDDAETHAMLGAALVRQGRFADAAEAFEFGRGCPWYEEQGIKQHADALRAIGQYRDAAELRLSQRMVDGPIEEYNHILAAVDDLRYGGFSSEAEDLAWEAIGLMPTLGIGHAYLADALLDQRKWEEAGFHLAYALSLENPSSRAALVHARFLMLEGNLGAAEDVLVGIVYEKRYNQAVALRAEVLRRQGLLSDAETIVDLPRYDDALYPEFLAVRIALLADRQALDEAESQLRVAQAMYPTHPDIRSAARYLEQLEN